MKPLHPHPPLARILLTLALGCVTAMPLFASADKFGLAELLQSIAVTPPASVRFREERHNPMFREPLVLEGYLEYPVEGVLVKTVELPFSETYRVEASGITVTRDGQEQRLTGQAGPALQAVFGSLEALLAGDLARLESAFGHRLVGTAESWSLNLQPRQSRIARHLRALDVSGGEGKVHQLKFDLGDDEWHLMTLHPDHDVPPADDGVRDE